MKPPHNQAKARSDSGKPRAAKRLARSTKVIPALAFLLSGVQRHRDHTLFTSAAFMTSMNPAGLAPLPSIRSGEQGTPTEFRATAASSVPVPRAPSCSNHSNWRVLGKSNSSSSVSPFCHDDSGDEPERLSLSGTESSALAHASWSETQYQNALELHDRLISCTDSYVAPIIKDALHCLENAFRLYGPHSVVGSYNGGKDAVVILHLMRAAHAKHCHEIVEKEKVGEDIRFQNPIIRPRVVYFDHADEFPEVTSLLRGTVDRFDLDMIAFERGVKFAEGLQILVDSNFPPESAASGGPPHPMAFVLGTRRDDPNAGSQGRFAPSSHYMPPFMRVNPIIDWSYGHVWHFLRLFQLPYCSLYDEGYTSLGTVKDTLPCPALAIPGTGGAGNGRKYWPAYMLRDWEQERAGRIKVEKKKPSISQSSSTVSMSSTEGADAKGAVLLSADSTVGDENRSQTSSSTTSGQRTVGLVIIGDEILKGLTPDTNTHAAALALRERNVPLSRVSVVSDDHESIVAEIKRMRCEVDVIITSGGIGPTHDDVTIKSICSALGKEMVFHEGMAKLLREKMGKDGELKEELTEAQLKMATLPSSSKLRYLTEDTNEWPVLQCKNVFILPGVPQFFEKKVEALADYLSTELERSVTYKVVLSIDENSIVKVLNKVVERHPDVSFGSYPFVSHPEFKTVVTLEGRQAPGGYSRNSGRFLTRRSSSSSDVVEASMVFSKVDMDMHVKLALADLINDLPEGSVLRVDNNDDLTFT